MNTYFWRLSARKPYCDFFEKKVLLTTAIWISKKYMDCCIFPVKENHDGHKFKN